MRKEEMYIKEKKTEIIWALSAQGYSNAQIATMFNMNRSTILRIIEKKPSDWSPKWKKIA